MSRDLQQRRHYLLADGRHVHHRRAGSGGAVVLLHEAPRSSASLAALLTGLADSATAIAIDLPGYGGSDPLPDVADPTIADYASWVREAVLALGLPRCAFYGEGAGAVVAVELARAYPELVSALVLDGVRAPTTDERADMRERYAPAVERRHGGGHLLEAWMRRRSEALFYPWYRRELAARIDRDVPDAERLQQDVLDALRAGDAYGALHRAELDHDVVGSLADVSVPVTAIALRDRAAERQLERLSSARLTTRIAEAADEHRELVLAALREQAALTDPAPEAPDATSAAPAAGAIARSYATTSRGQLLVRRAGPEGGRPLVMLHASPGSAAVLEPLILALARSRHVIAFDTLGHGDSDKLRFEQQPWIGDYAQIVAEAVDALGLEDFNVYGSHTGALIATEVGILLGDRVRNAILDGVGLFEPEFVADLLANYLPPLDPKPDGSHLALAWSIVWNGSLFWPWYRTTRAGIRWFESYGDDELDERVLDLLKSGATYSFAYRAAFSHPTAERLRLLRSRTLIGALEEDVLHESNETALSMGIDAQVVTLPDDLAGQVEAFERFLDGGA